MFGSVTLLATLVGCTVVSILPNDDIVKLMMSPCKRTKILMLSKAIIWKRPDRKRRKRKVVFKKCFPVYFTQETSDASVI
jgi:hypothetical protein